MLEPLGPSFLPNNPARLEPIKGKKTIVKYIFLSNLSNNGFEPLTTSL